MPVLPSKETMAKWENWSGLTDEEMQQMLEFFRFMEAGCRLMGHSYGLATNAFRHEADKAANAMWHRSYRTNQNGVTDVHACQS